ncbi:TetR/AcrR family transcriptional regulator [Peredibacter starrii]|uniref:TetR/AcrR family transcriptional regulator n=1 Tax=Peredibacter starrii TaxID=28202 RepID=A0AAX4HU13_9BACT|nr:TetR/AcrR family transcriptional regulator [Peredibacter starrii]WPU66701.1 TetR/AcrR family transcriptional regulator [Peredibacter starrii]
MKKTRDLERTRKEILDAAFMEVFSRGFQGVSIDDIVKKTTLTKGAFYHIFPTKLDLGYALVDDVIKPMIIERWINPLNEYENPLEGILKQLKTLIGKAPAEELKLGCPLNNLVQEMAPVDEGFHERLQMALNLWISEMDKQLKRAQKEGFIKKDVNTRQVAHFVVMAHEGFYGMLKGLNDKRAFDALYDSLRSYFQGIQEQ